MGKSLKSADRQQRLAAALRENLKRRKARDRAAAEDHREHGDPPGGDRPGVGRPADTQRDVSQSD